MCVDMCVGVYVDVCVNTDADMSVDLYMDMHTVQTLTASSGSVTEGSAGDYANDAGGAFEVLVNG